LAAGCARSARDSRCPGNLFIAAGVVTGVLIDMKENDHAY
jgi:hypothetical protein